MKTAIKVAYDKYIVLPAGAMGMNVMEAMEHAYIANSGYGNDNFTRVQEEQIEIGFYAADRFPDEDTDYKAQLTKAKQEASKKSTEIYNANKTSKELTEQLLALQAQVDALTLAAQKDPEDPGCLVPETGSDD